MNANKNLFSSKIDGLFWPLSVVSFRHRRTLTWMCQSKDLFKMDRAHFKLHLNQQYHIASKDADGDRRLMKTVTLQCIFTMNICHSTNCSNDNACPIFAQQIAFFRWNLHGCECIHVHWIRVPNQRTILSLWCAWNWKFKCENDEYGWLNWGMRTKGWKQQRCSSRFTISNDINYMR